MCFDYADSPLILYNQNLDSISLRHIYMLALLYLLTTLTLGASVCRRFYSFQSWLHYLAASFVVGLMLSTWLTYIFALFFASANQPLLWANILFFLVAAIVIYELGLRRALLPRLSHARPPGSTIWEAFFIGALFAVACYLMFGTLWLAKGNVCMAFVVWNDFGPNLSLMQSFAMGHNFPTEYPHFIGEPIRYHFLFWFQAGNLEFLGLNLAWALNLLSVLSLIAMLILLMTLGELLFHSRAVARIATGLFFFPTTLSYVPFLYSQSSFPQAVKAIIHLNHWLVSGYPYKGEDVGAWSLSIFYVQRHLLVGIAVLLLALIFLVDLFQRRADRTNNTLGKLERVNVSAGENAVAQTLSSPVEERVQSTEKVLGQIPSFVFTGFLLGLMPLFNSPAFVAALAVAAAMFVLFPFRTCTLWLLITAAAVSLPQIALVFLRGHGLTQGRRIIHWGLVVENPTIQRVLSYFSFTFGTKFLLGLIAAIIVARLPWRLFVAFLILPALAFTTQLTTDIRNNDKFLYIWIVLLNLFVAWTIWRIGKMRWIGKPTAVAVALVVSLGGMIEWFRIHNDTTMEVPFEANRLSTWLQANTRSTDVFLSDRFVTHPILLNGRRIFYGWPYFGESMGYPVKARDAAYDRMFTEKNATELVHLLNENGIRYVAIDNSLRRGYLKAKLNEAICQQYFETVFDDKEDRFAALKIYRVPDHLQKPAG